jgi:hypothetical protein
LFKLMVAMHIVRRASWLGMLGCALAALACEEELVEHGVSRDICASGTRWIGGNTPSEEMYPGRDCVGCHIDYGGPELMAGGTVYGVLDATGARTIDNDCFGVEGVRVTITTGDGQVLQTRTNRAGNFYFEGRESAFVKPFRAVVEYQLPDGTLSRQRMSSSPSYGGCARCHVALPEGTTSMGAEEGNVIKRDDVIDEVFPIFTGPIPDAGVP